MSACIKCRAALPEGAKYCPQCGKKQVKEARKALKRANGLGISRKTPHSTRHTYASRARRDGMPPELLQKILGHSDYTTTANIYVHTDVQELINAVENNTPLPK